MTLLLRPGGLLLGSTLGAPTARPWEASYQAGHTRWLHSADSLAAALEAAGFVQVEVAPTSWRVSAATCSSRLHVVLWDSCELGACHVTTEAGNTASSLLSFLVSLQSSVCRATLKFLAADLLAPPRTLRSTGAPSSRWCSSTWAAGWEKTTGACWPSRRCGRRRENTTAGGLFAATWPLLAFLLLPAGQRIPIAQVMWIDVFVSKQPAVAIDCRDQQHSTCKQQNRASGMCKPTKRYCMVATCKLYLG